MDNLFVNGDCMEGMATMPDKYIDLAIVDIPYGVFTGGKSGFMGHSYKLQQEANSWDILPGPEYFKELERVSKNRIIWGMQYVADYIPAFTQLIIWDKMNGGSYFADGEAAYCSIKGTLRIFRHKWCGHFKDSERGEKAIQPCQKPKELYRWLLKKYAKEGDLILDTHTGSGSSLIACEEMGFNYIAYEINEDYYKATCQRLKNHTDQLRIC